MFRKGSVLIRATSAVPSSGSASSREENSTSGANPKAVEDQVVRGDSPSVGACVHMKTDLPPGSANLDLSESSNTDCIRKDTDRVLWDACQDTVPAGMGSQASPEDGAATKPAPELPSKQTTRKRRDRGQTKKTIITLHEDIIKSAFWDKYPYILDSK